MLQASQLVRIKSSEEKKGPPGTLYDFLSEGSETFGYLCPQDKARTRLVVAAKDEEFVVG